MPDCSRTLATLVTFLLVNPLLAAGGYRLSDGVGNALTVIRGDRVIARYLYAYDTSSPAALHATYKPYLHVFDSSGTAPITKGPGGEFTHHRGIFIGWNRIAFNGKRHDRWHMKGGEIVHREFTRKEATKDGATFTSVTEWNDENGQPFIEEHRTMSFSPGGDAGRLIIDLQSTLKAVRGDVALNGDPEHAGIQFRPANNVDRAKTVYVFPRPDADPRKDRDYPWVGETFSLGDARHSVVHMNHPENPGGTRYSAYRDYGRFGAFFEREIPDGGSLTVKYRFLVADGEMPPARTIQKVWDEFAGVPSASPIPEISVIHAQ